MSWRRDPRADIKIINFSMGMNGRELVQDCTIEVTIGRRYGCSKRLRQDNFWSAWRTAVPIPEHIDMATRTARRSHEP